MKVKHLLILLICFIAFKAFAQSPGDTLKVRTFHYGSSNRDTLAVFPSGNLSFEKIIMKYSMRCKNGLVSNSTDRNLGCGEWDYSCNTYIVDSNKVEEALSTQPNYIIANFTGNRFPYTTKAVYDFYRFPSTKVNITAINADTAFTVGNGSIHNKQFLNATQKSGKSQFIYTISELNAAGLTPGSIQSIVLQVNNAGGKTGFLKVRMKHNDSSATTYGKPDMNGFTEVFFDHFTFVNGNNRIPFHTAFTWNGSQNILLEFSFTNTQADSAIELNCFSVADPSTVFANNGYALNLENNGHVRIDSLGLSSIKNEITISFWAYGNAALMPGSTTILYGYDNNSANRQLNIHLPHSSNNIYFDCGFAAGGYDRINKLSVPSEQGGKWNHWVFTKNASTGIMKIYLNGTEWFSGSGKTKAITLLNLFLGKDLNLQNNWKGRINDLIIWNKALPDSCMEGAMYQMNAQNLPYFSNVVALYAMNEGSGSSISNRINSASYNGSNLQWTYERGDKLFKSFYTSNIKPNISFCRGSYSLSLQPALLLDSVKRNANIIDQYSITSKAGVYPISNDVVNNLGSISNYYQASPSKIFEASADSFLVVQTIPVDSEGVLNISNLNYYRRFPFYNEIMSFVTPYGIGLDLGPNGKSWYYDVTDFAPLLKGNKRIVMTLGGQNQEQNDIEFWFVVGTPPRNVLEFNQIWQGTNRTGAASLVSINNESRFAPVNVPLLSTGKSFKIRSSITGHGSEGEFEANGGTVLHMLNLNGGDTDYVWSIVQRCAFNPVFPQGGTWVYDRQGWCPGQASMLRQQDITAKVTPGSTLNIDYLASIPPKTGGAYNYQVAHQLVTYGAPNFTSDARILEVIQPSDKILYGRSNPVCAQPKLNIQNSGSNTITSMEIKYWINNAGNKQTYTWTGTLASMESKVISLPINNLWNEGMLAANNQFIAEIVSVNGSADQYALNNKFISAFAKPVVIPSVFTLEIFTNNNPTENRFRLEDADGNLVDSMQFTKPNNLFSKKYNLGGCYKLIVEDDGEDGLQWWANTAQGTGYARIKNGNGTVIKTFQADFGAGFEFNFTTNWLLSQNELSFGQMINLYPNPAKGKFILEGSELEFASVQITDVLGHIIELPQTHMGTKVEVNSSQLQAGVYFVVISNGEQKSVKELVIY